MTNDYTTTETKKLRRSRDDKMVAGVCGGIAKYLKVDPAVVRIGMVAAAILGLGCGALFYVACWVLMPEEDTA